MHGGDGIVEDSTANDLPDEPAAQFSKSLPATKLGFLQNVILERGLETGTGLQREKWLL